MNQTKVNKIVISAVFAALTCVMTMFFPIKLPSGYANLGDCFVILAGCAVGPLWGAAAAAIGASLADLLLGYALYAPATFVIKALMAVAAALIFSGLKNKNLFTSVLVSAVCAELIMVAGYFVFECVLYGAGTAAADIMGNAVQGVVGIAASVCLLLIMNKNTYLKKLF